MNGQHPKQVLLSAVFAYTNIPIKPKNETFDSYSIFGQFILA